MKTRNFRESLIYKQVILTLFMSLIGGLLLVITQLCYELNKLQDRIEMETNREIELIYNTTSKIAFDLNTKEAQFITQGLIKNKDIESVKIIDNFGNTLAELNQNEIVKNPLLPLFNINKYFKNINLIYENVGVKREVGNLYITINPISSYNDFAKDLSYKMILQFSLAFILVGIFSFLFIKKIISPLSKLSQQVSMIDPNNPNLHPLSIKSNHNDEIDIIIIALNNLMSAFQESLNQRDQAKQSLSQLNNQLENIVFQRTQELHNTLKQLESKKEIAEKASKVKSEFLAVISHELRTPLNGIIGCAELLLLDKQEPTTKEMLNVIHKSGLNLLQLIENILDFSKIEN